MASVQKTLVFDEVAKHNKLDDCWIIISGKVYDVTPFMEDHPGGGEVMRKATGKDATVDYSDVGHSAAANEMMGKYYVGEIDESTIPAKKIIHFIDYRKDLQFKKVSTVHHQGTTCGTNGCCIEGSGSLI